MPLTTFGSGILHASRIVGTTSMTWWNWVRISPFALIPLGQWTTIGLRVPPKWLATCLVHWNGASIAHAQPTGTCGSLVGPPISSIRLIVLSRPSCTPSRLATSLNVPSSPPSALAPLSPTM